MKRSQRPSKARANICPITASEVNRKVANQSTAAIQDNFPPGVAQPALRALVAAGYTTLDQLAKVKEADLAKLHGMGPKALGLLRAALNQRGKTFVT